MEVFQFGVILYQPSGITTEAFSEGGQASKPVKNNFPHPRVEIQNDKSLTYKAICF
jgi:hypothetical protein